MSFSLNYRAFLLLLPLSFTASTIYSQFLMDILDTTSDVGSSILSVTRKYDNLRIGGYIQSQFQFAEQKGISSYAGGDFQSDADNRFMLRRGRIRFDYAHFPEGRVASVHFVLQFDGTERGVNIRDFWGRILENKYKMFSLTTGLFARPISYELNMSSSDRETPERGRMSQILMRTERDMGAMISFEPRVKSHPLHYIKFDAGLFNGQGLSGPSEYDSHKDFISRIYLKEYPLSKKVFISGGASILAGGIQRNTKYRWSIADGHTGKTFIVDSSRLNISSIAPRKYYGADAQLKIKSSVGATELRAEFLRGKQTAFLNTSETPTSLPTDSSTGFYTRNFNGAYFYFVQNLFNKDNQLLLKYDWYDPNTDVARNDIGAAGTNLNAADIEYSTIGIGFLHHFSDHAKVVAYYDFVTNEKTKLNGFVEDVDDNVLTLRVQFRF